MKPPAAPATAEGCLPKPLGGDGTASLEGDGRSEPAELLLEVLVAAQYVAGAIHYGSALGRQARQHQRCPAPQVRRLHDGTGEGSGALDEGAVPAEEVYAGVHPVELLGHLKPVLVDVL